MFQSVAVPGVDLAGEHVDRRLVRFVQMCLGSRAGRQGEQVHADALGADALGGDTFEIAQPLFSVIGVAGAHQAAGGL